ncbi:MAG TPA: hypothetical protein VGN57_14260 [Pirellulaceae bacterium]|jgi:TIGR03009 family protein|nr:hypothetical protein [Pirellulaceae bacterium]
MTVTTRLLHSALLLGLASAGLASSPGAFAQGDLAPVDANAASDIAAGIDLQGSHAPAGPAVDPHRPPAQIREAFSAWLEYWKKPAAPQRLPRPFPPQSEKELAYIEELLTHWEQRSAKVRSYNADFNRWVTAPLYGPAHTFKTFSKGEIRYESPDKGLFRIDCTGQWTPPADRGEKATWPDMGDAGKEQWICDGKSLFEFDYAQKKLVERQLPPEMQGLPVAEGRLPFAFGPFFCLFEPLPFVFGVKKETIQSRYWLRVTTDKEAQEKGEYRLEAYPKLGDDAVNYDRIEIIIAGCDFQVSAIKICERNNVETIYQFTNRSSNGSDDPDQVARWRSEFTPATPAGWERIVEPAPGDTAD